MLWRFHWRAHPIRVLRCLRSGRYGNITFYGSTANTTKVGATNWQACATLVPPQSQRADEMNTAR
eukprot:285175-Prymnesium_polylepis.1